ncbi:MAG TPA: hypothetical protein VGD65_24625 [Chryseosolibacter sp.]
MEFSTYKTFYEQDSAIALADILKANNIDYEIAEDRESLDSLYGDKHLSRQFLVKLKKDDFARVDALVLASVEEQVTSIDRDHYLFQFTDDELFEILTKPDEWSALDFQLAKKILKERGKDINETTIALLRTQRINELAKPEDGPKAWIYAGYVFAVLGGLIGVCMGLALMTAKKTLPNGQRVYTYSEDHRAHGTRIFFIGATMFAISLIVRIATADFG